MSTRCMFCRQEIPDTEVETILVCISEFPGGRTTQQHAHVSCRTMQLVGIPYTPEVFWGFEARAQFGNELVGLA